MRHLVQTSDSTLGSKVGERDIDEKGAIVARLKIGWRPTTLIPAIPEAFDQPRRSGESKMRGEEINVESNL
jgi:hypothetical protein